MKGFYLVEEGHVVNALPPVNINGGANSKVISLKEYKHASIIIKVGAASVPFTVTVEECDDIVPTNRRAIEFDYNEERVSDGDILSELKKATVSGFATAALPNTLYVISIDSSQLSDGFPYLRVNLSNPGASVFADVTAVLTGARYQEQVTRTALI